MFEEKAFGMTLDHGQEVVKFVRQGGRDMPVGVGFVIYLPVFRAARCQRRSHFIIG